MRSYGAQKRANRLLQSPSSDAIENHKKIRFGIWGVWWSIFNENLRNVKCHKLHTHILIDISVVDSNVHFPKHRETYIFKMFKASGHAKDFLNRLLFSSGAPELFKLYQGIYENVQPLFLTSISLCCVQHHRWKMLWATPSNLIPNK